MDGGNQVNIIQSAKEKSQLQPLLYIFDQYFYQITILVKGKIATDLISGFTTEFPWEFLQD